MQPALDLVLDLDVDALGTALFKPSDKCRVAVWATHLDSPAQVLHMGLVLPKSKPAGTRLSQT